MRPHRTWSGILRTLTVGAMALSFAPPLTAQTGSVAGTVTDRTTQRPLVAAQVSIKGTRIGTQVGASGRYTIPTVPTGARTVVVRALGYALQEREVTITAGARETLDFQLNQQAISLNEVVVTGTGSATEVRKVGTSLASVNAADLTEKFPVLGVDQLIKGRTPGVIMNLAQGSVGTQGQIKIRGTKSISLGSDPVIYIDGVRVNNNDDRPIFIGGQGINRTADLNPADIERIEVVRGAAAATLYGTQGSNGVIQIFTKRGRTGAPEWLLEAEGGYERSPTSRFPGRLWTQFVGPNNFRAHDPKEIVDNGRYERYMAQVSGGGENVTYFTSLSFQGQNSSIAPDANWNNIVSTRGNLNAVLTPKLSMAVRSGFVFNKLRISDNDNALHGLYSQVVAGLPYTATPDRPWGERFGSFYANATLENLQTVLRNTTGITMDYRPRENFSHNLTLGIDWFDDEFQKYFPYAYLGSGNKLGSKNNIARSYRDITVDYKTSLNFAFKPWMNFESSAGVQGDFANTNRVTATGTDFPAPGVRTVSSASTRTAGETRVETVNAGLYFQETLGLWDKIFVTGGLRVDGNSAFGNDFQYQNYPKASVAYTVSQEKFWPTRLVPTMKLRLAYGTSGLAPAQFAADRTYAPISAQNGQPAVTPNNLGNPDLGPETTTEIEAGFDAGFLDDRLGVEFTYYHQTVTDALLRRPQPPSLGFLNAQLTNIGEVRNTGIETSINALLMRRASMEWNARLNYSTNNSEILDMGGLAPFFVSDARIVKGYPVNSVWRVPLQSWNPVTRRHTAAIDRVYAGRIDPKWFGSLATDVRWRNWTLSTSADFQGGNKKIDFTHWWDTRVRSGDHYLSLVQKPNGTPTPASDSLLDFVQAIGSTAYVEEADFLAISEAALSYQFPDSWTRRAGFRRATVRLSGRNVRLWTKYPGVDPRLAWQGNLAVGASSDFDSQPIPHVYLLTFRATR